MKNYEICHQCEDFVYCLAIRGLSAECPHDEVDEDEE